MADKKENKKEEGNRFAYSDSTGLELVSKGKDEEVKDKDKKKEDEKSVKK